MRGVIKSFSAAATALAGAIVVVPAAAQDFDYYLLALSWAPSWCVEAAEPDHEQCDPRRDLGFILHGLWPQYENGWPEDCGSPHADPSRRETAAMADIMGSGGLAWHQWRKHGRCSGLPAAAYFAAARRAFAGLDLDLGDGTRTTAAALEEGFLAANPGFDPDGVVVTCAGGRVKELRLCLGAGLAPRRCAPDVLADACRTSGTLDLPPVR
jgi:ribonuclease T2